MNVQSHFASSSGMATAVTLASYLVLPVLHLLFLRGALVKSSSKRRAIFIVGAVAVLITGLEVGRGGSRFDPLSIAAILLMGVTLSVGLRALFGKQRVRPPRTLDSPIVAGASGILLIVLLVSAFVLPWAQTWNESKLDPAFKSGLMVATEGAETSLIIGFTSIDDVMPAGNVGCGDEIVSGKSGIRVTALSAFGIAYKNLVISC